MKENAKKYLDIGLSVIPIGTIKIKPGGGKDISYPVPWKKYQFTRASHEEVSTWDYPNLGIVSGRISGVLVLDVDSYKSTYDDSLFKSLKIPPTPCQRTGRGGTQYFFRHPGFEIRNDVSVGHSDSCIDIRCDGGMVIVAPSSIEGVGSYEWIVSPFDADFADVPESLLKILEHKTEGSRVSTPMSSLVSIPEGSGRNNAMASLIGKFAYAIKDHNKWIVEIPPLANAVNATYLPPLSSEEMMSIYNSITGIELKRRKEDIKDITKTPEIIDGAMSFSELLSQEFPKARFSVEPFFESGTVNMVSAPPNTWKSWFLFYISSYIAKGEMVWGKFSTEQSKVMIVNEEDSYRAIQDRFKLLGIVDKNLPIYFHVAKGLKIDETFVKNILIELKQKDIKVLILDSLRSMHQASENDSTEMQKILDYLKEISRQDVTVIFTHHNRKKSQFGKTDDAESTRGSSAINAAVSGHISLEEEIRDLGTYLIIRHLKSKAGEKEQPFEIKIEKNNGRISFHYEGNFKDAERKIMAAKDSILNILSNEDYKTVKDFTKVGVAGESVVREALKKLKEDKLVATITRGEALARRITVGSLGKPNEVLYSIVDHKQHVVDKDLEEIEQSAINNLIN